MLNPAGQRLERLGQPLEDEGDRADQQGIDHQRLDQQANQGSGRWRRDQHAGHGPRAIGLTLDRRDDHTFRQAVHFAPAHAPLKPSLGHRIRADLTLEHLDRSQGHPLVGQDHAQRFLLFRQPLVSRKDPGGHVLARAGHAAQQPFRRWAAKSVWGHLVIIAQRPVKPEGDGVHQRRLASLGLSAVQHHAVDRLAQQKRQRHGEQQLPLQAARPEAHRQPSPRRRRTSAANM